MAPPQPELVMAARVRQSRHRSAITLSVLIVISPAKSLDYSSALPTKKHSHPRMLGEAAQLVEVMRRKSPDELAAMMGISANLAELNHERFNDWEAPFTPSTARPSVLAFSGDVYRSMDAGASFTERDFTQAQKVLRILSGLYGVLRPLDLMQPYRLEMGSRLATEHGGSLYEFWGERITDALNADLAASPGTKALVNLASNEYFRSVDSSKLDGHLVTPKFLDAKAEWAGTSRRPRVLGYFAKQARGAMAGWIIRERVKSMRGLRAFDGLGYDLSPERSTARQPVFVRWS